MCPTIRLSLATPLLVMCLLCLLMFAIYCSLLISGCYKLLVFTVCFSCLAHCPSCVVYILLCTLLSTYHALLMMCCSCLLYVAQFLQSVANKLFTIYCSLLVKCMLLIFAQCCSLLIICCSCLPNVVHRLLCVVDVSSVLLTMFCVLLMFAQCCSLLVVCC